MDYVSFICSPVILTWPPTGSGETHTCARTHAHTDTLTPEWVMGGNGGRGVAVIQGGSITAVQGRAGNISGWGGGQERGAGGRWAF